MRRLPSAILTMFLGMLIGLGVGVLLALWILIVYLRSGEAAFAAKGTTFGFMVLLYLAGGVVAGGVAGLLGPLARGPARYLVSWIGWIWNGRSRSCLPGAGRCLCCMMWKDASTGKWRSCLA